MKSLGTFLWKPSSPRTGTEFQLAGRFLQRAATLAGTGVFLVLAFVLTGLVATSLFPNANEEASPIVLVVVGVGCGIVFLIAIAIFRRFRHRDHPKQRDVSGEPKVIRERDDRIVRPGPGS